MAPPHPDITTVAGEAGMAIGTPRSTPDGPGPAPDAAAGARALTPAEVGAAAVAEGMAAFGARSGSFVVLDPARRALDVVHAAGYAEPVLRRWPDVPLDAEVPLAAAVRGNANVLVGSHEEIVARYPAIAPTVAATGSQALAVVVVREGEEAVAALGLAFAEPRAFPPDEAAAMDELAVRVGRALERARLRVAEREARGRLAFLVEASAVLGASLDPAVALRTLAERIVPRLADFASVQLTREDGTLEMVEIAHVDPAMRALARAIATRPRREGAEPGVSDRVLRTGDPELIPAITPEMLAAAAEDEEHRRQLLAIDLSSMMVLPLIARGERLGVIAVGRSGATQPYGPDDLDFMQDLAGRAAVAIANARTHLAEERARREAERATARTERLQAVTAALADTLTPDDVARVLVETGAAALGAVAAKLALADPHGHGFRVVRSRNVPGEIVGRWSPFGQDDRNGMAEAVRTRTPVFAPDPDALRERFPEWGQDWIATGAAAYAAIPLLAEGRAIGAIGLGFAERREFPPADVGFLLALARQGAQALERARLYEAERRARRDAEQAIRRANTLQAITAAVSEALTLSDVARALIEQSRVGLGATGGWVALLTGDRRTLRLVSQEGFAGELADRWATFDVDLPVPITEAIRTLRPVIVDSPDDTVARFPVLAADRGRLAEGPVVHMPLSVEGRALGALALTFPPGTPFPDADLAFIQALTRQSAQALERARLYEAESVARGQAEQAERRARREGARLAALANLSRALAEVGVDHDAAVEAVARITAEHTGDCCVVRLVSDDGEWMDVSALHHPDPAAKALFLELAASHRQRADEGFSSGVLETGEPLLVPDAGRPREMPGVPREAWRRMRLAGVESLLVVPLRARGRRLGSMAMLRDRPGLPYVPDDIGFGQELADRAALAIDNARLYREARDAVRARDEFLSVAAHELRTPVTTVKGYSQMLLRGYARDADPTGRTGQFLEAIDQATDRLRLLADDLLDVSRLRLGQLPLRFRDADLGELARAAVDRFAAREDDAHPVTLELRGAPHPVLADPDRIDQILGNLLDNAAKYSPAGGPIAVVVEPGEDGVGVRLSVADRGIGLPPGTEETIFEPFNRAPNATRENLPGLGLGLSICRSIADRHDGRIWAESAGEGEGTTVRLWLPSAGDGVVG